MPDQGGRTDLKLLVVGPAAVLKLIRREQLRLVAGHGVEDVEQRLLRKLGEVARLQPRRRVPIALGHLQPHGGQVIPDTWKPCSSAVQMLEHIRGCTQSC